MNVVEESDQADQIENKGTEERKIQSPIKVEQFSDSDKSLNAAEVEMVSHNDILIEIDQGLNDKNRRNSDSMNTDNGKALRYIRMKEKEVKLFQNQDEEFSLCDNNQQQTNFNKKSNKFESMNSLTDDRLKMLEAEVMLESNLRILDIKMKDSETGEYDKGKLQPFLREYITYENRVREAKMILQELLENSEKFKSKFDLDVKHEHDKFEDDNQKEKALLKTVKTNIHKGKLKSDILKLKKKNLGTQNMSMVHPGHENFNLVFNIMLGIKKAIDAVFDFPFNEIQKKDFKIKCVYEIAPWRTTEDDNLKACVFLDYAPQVFHFIRKKFNIKREEYSKSLGPDQILTNLLTGDFNSLSELCSSGKSGSFFYYTADAKYMLKTISKNEFKFFKSILKNYYNHIESNDETMITRIFGLHKMIFFRKNRKTEKVLYFCIMNNVFHTAKEIHKRYDLKGSTQGRTTKYANGIFDPTIALKDNDIIDQEEYFIVSQQLEIRLKSQIKSDVHLLVGIHDVTAESQKGDKSLVSKDSEFSYNDPQTPTYREVSNNISTPFYEKKEGGMENFNQKQIYFMGIIDILTEYNTKKKLEHFFKSLKYGNTISCVPPDFYASRFDHFITSRIINANDYKEICIKSNNRFSLCSPPKLISPKINETENIEKSSKHRSNSKRKSKHKSKKHSKSRKNREASEESKKFKEDD